LARQTEGSNYAFRADVRHKSFCLEGSDSVLSKQTRERRKKSTQLFCSISASARKAMLLKAEMSWHKAQLAGGLIQAGLGGTGVYSSKEQ